MRFVQLSVPAGRRGPILAALDAGDVEPTLARFREAGVGEDAWIVVLEARTVVSGRSDRLETDENRSARRGRIAREELRTAAADLAPEHSERWSYVAMTIVSAVVAAIGSLRNSAAVGPVPCTTAS